MEHCDILNGVTWKFYYDDALFAPSTDSFVLSSFPKLKSGLRVCDLGAGTGLVGLLLLRRQPELSITGIELEEGALSLAERNRRTNGLTKNLQFLHGDLRRRETLPAAGSFDLAVCNPPYFPMGSGAAANGEARRNARGEESCTLEDVCTAASRLLRWGGSFCLVYRPDRMVDLTISMRTAGLEMKRIRTVSQTAEYAPSLLLAEGRRGGRPGLRWEPPLYLKNTDGTPTRESNAIYQQNGDDTL